MVKITEEEHQAIENLLKAEDLKGFDPQGAVDQALSAYVSGRISSTGTKILEAAGIQLLGHGVWGKEEIQHEPLVEGKFGPIRARQILVEGKARELYPSDPPSDDEEAVREAEALLGSISGKTEDEQILLDLAKKTVDDTIIDPEPWPGYDELRVGGIKEVLIGGSVSYGNVEADLGFLDAVEQYESEHKDRKNVYRYVAERRKQIAEQQEEPQGEEASEENETDSAASEVVSGRKVAVKGSTTHSQGPPSREGITEPDASIKPGTKTPQQSKEDRDGEHEGEQGGKDRDYETLVADAEVDVNSQLSNIPPEPPGNSFELPWDLTQLSDKKLQEFYGVYTALAYRVNYKLMLEEAKLRRTKMAVRELHQELFNEASKYDDRNHQRTIGDVTAEIEQNSLLKKWRRRENLHETAAQSYKTELEALNKTIDTLSRLETMRHQEWERGRR